MVLIHVDCPVCSKNVEIKIDEEKIQSSIRNPVPIVFTHGSPEHALTVFIDKEYHVRAVSGANIVQRIAETRAKQKPLTRRYVPVPKTQIPNLKGLDPVQLKILALADGSTSVEELASILGVPAMRVKIVCEQLVRLKKLDKIKVVME
ncbi:MAG: hypothetical protein K9W43_10760 [Candidatus Thorarchaeota archaeon]|nr:hypothetical protein [Candidatus Thorarchaeota archaeon]